MKLLRTSILALALLLPWVVEGAGQDTFPAEPTLRQLETAPETVTAIYQDKAGFLWLGSREGLALYDGYSFQFFEHDVADPTSISANLIRSVFEDSRGGLWVGTNTGGLNHLDRTNWTFKHYRHDSTKSNSLSHDSVYTIQEDNEGFLWVGTQIGLNRLNLATGVFQRYPADPDDSRFPSHDYINTIHKDRNGILWIGTVGGGLNRLDPATGLFRKYRHDPDDEATISDDSVFAIAEQEDGSLWLGTEKGIGRFDPKTGKVERFSNISPDPADKIHDLVTSLALGDEGLVYIGTWGNGVKVFNPSSDPGSAVRFQDVELKTPSERIVCLTTDAAGSIWVGAWGQGLGRVRPDSHIFSTIAIPGEKPSASLNEVTSVLEDSQGRLWIGNYQGPLVRRDPGETDFRHYENMTSTLLTLFEDTDGSLWSGTPAGLQSMDPKTGTVSRYRHEGTDPASLGAGWVWAILRDRQGRMWIGTGEAGLNRMLEGGAFERYTNDPSDPTSMSDNYVIAIHEGDDGRLWVGTRSGGLNRFNPETGKVTRFLPDPADAGSLSHHYVSSLFEDSKGRLWVGTGGGGINQLRQEADGTIVFKRYTEHDGLVNNNVMGMVEDDDGSLWITTQSGLSRFNPDTEKFINYDLGDGLPSLEFDVGSVSAGRTHLYFGSTQGTMAVRRGTPFPTPVDSPVVLASIQSSGRLLIGDKPAWELENLNVPYGKILSFEFAVLDFEERYRHRYSYRLGGLRDEWIELGSRREITFTDLKPGRFTLQVRGRSAEGVWSDVPVVLNLVVVPPFWMTDWFRLLLVMAATGIIIGVHRWRTADLSERHRRLQIVQDQREQALEEVQANQRLLHLAYDRLRRLTQRLEAAKEDERKRIARELHDEMGQALTTAKINLELMHGLEDPDENEQRINDTISLMDGMIRHVRALSLDLRPPLLDELGLIPAIRNYLDIQSHRSGIKIDVAVDPVPQGLSPEIEILAFRVVQEALTNILRHASASLVTVAITREPAWLEITVEDNGCGFDVDAAMERGARGHHLGLLGIRERVESTGGRVAIDSTLGHGARIHVDVPLYPAGEDHADPSGG
jgi:signal transduction histidine kinase/ligand-binding sensor domain-containing protein